MHQIDFDHESEVRKNYHDQLVWNSKEKRMQEPGKKETPRTGKGYIAPRYEEGRT